MKQLLFVYNADAGFFNMVTDIAHKIFSPATYPCSLCDLTYGILKIRPEWEQFVQNAPVPFVFLHKDEFLSAYPDLKNTVLPVVLLLHEKGSSELISAAELDGFKSVEALSQVILDRLDAIESGLCQKSGV